MPLQNALRGLQVNVVDLTSFVVPAKPGIQVNKDFLDQGFHRDDVKSTTLGVAGSTDAIVHI